MLKIIKRYNNLFDIDKARGWKKLVSGFMLTLPHIITCILLIFFFPEKWLGILIVGLLLPDISYFFYMFVYPGALLKKDHLYTRLGKYRKKVAHILTFVVVILLILAKEYVVAISGAIHLLLDMIGF
ncbi:hypothetical protein GF336_04465 [Candidatus Woesearchaeota archaeon]|nr:hypothetical protein [Candidatus Woesearchaeota archaeon]